MDQTLILRIICHAAICWTSFLTILNSGRSIVLKSTTPRSWKSRQKREKVIDIMASILYVGGKIACHPGLRASTHHASSRPLCSPNSPADLGRHSVLCGMVVWTLHSFCAACTCTIGFGYKYSRTKVVGLRAVHISLELCFAPFAGCKCCDSQLLGLATGVHVWASLRWSFTLQWLAFVYLV